MAPVAGAGEPAVVVAQEQHDCRNPHSPCSVGSNRSSRQALRRHLRVAWGARKSSALAFTRQRV